METKVDDLVGKITGFVNSYGSNNKEFIDAMNQEHRTLQQSFTRLILMWIEHCAKDDYRYDGRNEATHRICKDIVKSFTKLKEEEEPLHWINVKPSEFLPFI